MGFKQKQLKLAVLIVKLCYGFPWLLCSYVLSLASTYERKLQNTLHQRCSHLCGSWQFFLSYVFILQMCAWIFLSYQICCQYVILRDFVSNVGIVYLPFVTGMFAVIFTNSSKDCVCVYVCVCLIEDYEYESQNSFGCIDIGPRILLLKIRFSIPGRGKRVFSLGCSYELCRLPIFLCSGY